MSPATSSRAAATPSMMVLASRVIGIAAGSMYFVCARHSAAIASPSGRHGAASARRAGVLIGRPSSATAKPAGSSRTATSS